MSSEEVLKLIRSLPSKSSPLDSLPTPLLKKYILILSPILSKLANLSFSTGIFPSIFERAQVLSFLKKTKSRPKLSCQLQTYLQSFYHVKTVRKTHFVHNPLSSLLSCLHTRIFYRNCSFTHLQQSLWHIWQGHKTVMVGFKISEAFDQLSTTRNCWRDLSATLESMA